MVALFTFQYLTHSKHVIFRYLTHSINTMFQYAIAKHQYTVCMVHPVYEVYKWKGQDEVLMKSVSIHIYRWIDNLNMMNVNIMIKISTLWQKCHHHDKHVNIIRKCQHYTTLWSTCQHCACCIYDQFVNTEQWLLMSVVNITLKKYQIKEWWMISLQTPRHLRKLHTHIDTHTKKQANKCIYTYVA